MGIWRDGFSFHPATKTSGQMWVRFTVSCVIRDIAALLISSLIVDPCYSWRSSSFFCVCLQQFQCSDLECFREMLCMPRKPFSPQSYTELQIEILNAFWDFQPTSVNSKGSSNAPCVTTQDNMRFIFCSLLLQLRKLIESAIESVFKWCTKRLLYLMCVHVWRVWENWWNERTSGLKGWCEI